MRFVIPWPSSLGLKLPSPGIKVNDTAPLIKWENGQGRIAEVSGFLPLLVIPCSAHVPQQLRAAGQEVVARMKAPPNLLVVILPEGGNDIYTAVKQ